MNQVFPKRRKVFSTTIYFSTYLVFISSCVGSINRIKRMIYLKSHVIHIARNAVVALTTLRTVLHRKVLISQHCCQEAIPCSHRHQQRYNDYMLNEHKSNPNELYVIQTFCFERWKDLSDFVGEDVCSKKIAPLHYMHLILESNLSFTLLRCWKDDEYFKEII